MVFDLARWQQELSRIARSLELRAARRRWTTASDAALEKDVMLGFYAVRKMLPNHAFRSPPYLESPPKIPVIACPRNQQRVSGISWPEVGEAFDLAAPNGQTRDIEYICNQVIHSYYFATWIGPDKKLKGVFCCSDTRKDQEIYRLEVPMIIDLFNAVSASQHRVASMRHFTPDDNRVVM